MAKKVKIPNKATVIKSTVFVILPIVFVAVAFIIYRQYFYHNRFINKSILGKDMEFKYFTYDEFDSKSAPEDREAGLDVYYKKGAWYITDSGKNNVNKDSIARLDRARDIIEKEHNSVSSNRNIYFVINSGYRSDAHNEDVGGVINSAHRNKGGGSHAFDISWSKYNQQERNVIEEALRRVGFNRIGIYNSFIHADDDYTLPNPATW